MSTMTCIGVVMILVPAIGMLLWATIEMVSSGYDEYGWKWPCLVAWCVLAVGMIFIGGLN